LLKTLSYHTIRTAHTSPRRVEPRTTA